MSPVQHQPTLSCQEEKLMHCLRVLIATLFLAALLTACTTTPGQVRGKVVCPACGNEFDALFEKRF
jgi:starvation-inducible outer membrane lipoprotein